MKSVSYLTLDNNYSSSRETNTPERGHLFTRSCFDRRHRSAAILLSSSGQWTRSCIPSPQRNNSLHLVQSTTIKCWTEPHTAQARISQRLLSRRTPHLAARGPTSFHLCVRLPLASHIIVPLSSKRYHSIVTGRQKVHTTTVDIHCGM